jgi:hypothetical protein
MSPAGAKRDLRGRRPGAGQDAQLLEVPGDHFSITDPAAPAWPVVIGALEELMSAGS